MLTHLSPINQLKGVCFACELVLHGMPVKQTRSEALYILKWEKMEFKILGSIAALLEALQYRLRAGLELGL